MNALVAGGELAKPNVGFIFNSFIAQRRGRGEGLSPCPLFLQQVIYVDSCPFIYVYMLRLFVNSAAIAIIRATNLFEVLTC